MKIGCLFWNNKSGQRGLALEEGNIYCAKIYCAIDTETAKKWLGEHLSRDSEIKEIRVVSASENK